MMMTAGPLTHQVMPLFPRLPAPRAYPCQAAGIGLGSVVCGATPASLWQRSCPVVVSHTRQVWLCGTHASLIVYGRGGCAECLARGVASRAVLAPLDLLLLGHAGGGR